MEPVMGQIHADKGRFGETLLARVALEGHEEQAVVGRAARSRFAVERFVADGLAVRSDGHEFPQPVEADAAGGERSQRSP